jgi:tetratricopeptide (TPR) repeat protein
MTAKAPNSNKKVFQAYEKAVSLVHASKYSQALKSLNTLATKHPDDSGVQARVKNYIKICEKRSRQPAALPSSADELYDLGVFNHNAGDYEKALELFAAAAKKSDEAGFVSYATAATYAMKGDETLSVANLTTAIAASDKNRIQAQNDPDFRALADSAAFKLLVWPE